MSEARTVSTPAAEAAVQQMASILSGNLTGDLSRLRGQAIKLSDPDIWDGRAATDFRGSVWPASDRALAALETQLQELRSKIDIITRDIMAAG